MRSKDFTMKTLIQSVVVLGYLAGMTGVLVFAGLKLHQLFL